jgi:hypothetical protein
VITSAEFPPFSSNDEGSREDAEAGQFGLSLLNNFPILTTETQSLTGEFFSVPLWLDSSAHFGNLFTTRFLASSRLSVRIESCYLS